MGDLDLLGRRGRRHGRPTSWALIAVIIASVCVGGAMLIAQAWTGVYVCAGVFVACVLVAPLVGIMGDTVTWTIPRGRPAERRAGVPPAVADPPNDVAYPGAAPRLDGVRLEPVRAARRSAPIPPLVGLATRANPRLARPWRGRRRVGAVVALAAVRGLYGVVVAVDPAPLARGLGLRRLDAATTAGARVLGARHLAQALFSATLRRGAVSAVGAGVDALHAASMLALAAADRRLRRAALADAAIAGVFGIAGLAAARQTTRSAKDRGKEKHERSSTAR